MSEQMDQVHLNVQSNRIMGLNYGGTPNARNQKKNIGPIPRALMREKSQQA